MQELGRRDAARHFLQVFRILREGLAMQPAVPHQRAADIKGRVKALVQVQCEGIRTLDPRHQMPISRRNGNHGADAAIDMQPQTLLARTDRRWPPDRRWTRYWWFLPSRSRRPDAGRPPDLASSRPELADPCGMRHPRAPGTGAACQPSRFIAL